MRARSNHLVTQNLYCIKIDLKEKKSATDFFIRHEDIDGVIHFAASKAVGESVNNPLKYYKKADVFVLSSHVEGLPNVLVEAMMCGCTPVSTDCPTGPREVLEGGKYGYLVPMKNSKSLAQGIIQALKTPISEDLLNEAVQPFEENKVLEAHTKALKLTMLL